MNTGEKLAQELVWESDGHLSEVAITVAADGQEHLLPADAEAHLGECESCMRRVGQAAILSMAAGEQLVQLGAQAVAAQRTPARAPLPVWALVGALVLAAVGALPALSNAPVQLAHLWTQVMSVAPHVVRGGLALARSGSAAFGPGLWAASLCSVLVLFVAGLAIARMAPRAGLVRAAQRGGG